MKLLMMMRYAWREELTAEASDGRLMALGSTEPVIEANETIPRANPDHAILRYS